MVGEEFIPLDVSQYSQTIQKIQKAKPDVLMTLISWSKTSLISMSNKLQLVWGFQWPLQLM